MCSIDILKNHQCFSLLQEDSPHAGRSRLRSSCCSSVESAEGEDVAPPLYGTKLYNTGSGCSPLAWAEPFPGTLCSLCSYGPDSDSLSSAGDCSLALAGLRGSVSQGDACYAGPFFKEVERNAGEEEEDTWQSVDNEGIIFYNKVSYLCGGHVVLFLFCLFFYVFI